MSEAAENKRIQEGTGAGRTWYQVLYLPLSCLSARGGVKGSAAYQVFCSDQVVYMQKCLYGEGVQLWPVSNV